MDAYTLESTRLALELDLLTPPPPRPRLKATIRYRGRLITIDAANPVEAAAQIREACRGTGYLVIEEAA